MYRGGFWAVWESGHQGSEKHVTLQVPADEVIEVKQEPKIDFTYSGQQKLDLGFGPLGTSSAQPVQTLSWERLRRVGTYLHGGYKASNTTITDFLRSSNLRPFEGVCRACVSEVSAILSANAEEMSSHKTLRQGGARYT